VSAEGIKGDPEKKNQEAEDAKLKAVFIRDRRMNLDEQSNTGAQRATHTPRSALVAGPSQSVRTQPQARRHQTEYTIVESFVVTRSHHRP